jgi:predicted FMN-binding regulatory protein PaiB
MTDRDKWMVDQSKIVLAVWNGEEVKNSGTWHTVKYAKKRQRPTWQLNPHTLEISLYSR